MNKKRVAIGIGCRKECFAGEIIELVHDALEKSDLVISDIAVIATVWAKEKAEAIIHTADALDLPLIIVPQEKCVDAASLAESSSPKVVELFAIPSVAEVAALAAAGKNATLVCPKISSAAATCAIAISEGK